MLDRHLPSPFKPTENLVAAPANLALTVFRFNNNGSVDSTFGSNGATAIQAAGSSLHQPVEV